MIYRIYGKHKTDKRYSALGSDGLCNNLIYAYFFDIETPEDLISLDNKIEELNIDNPEYTFIKRKV